MGNQHSIAMKQAKKSKASNPEEFIIDFHRQQMRNGLDTTCNIKLCDRRRVVFISLIGLYQTWSLCPAHVLYSSIFMLPLKKKWIYSPITYKHEMDKTILGRIKIFEDPIVFEEFLMLLRWKDSQNLAFWMLDEYEMHDMDGLISPFWRHFSERLTNLYDAVTKAKYKAIKFEANWWRYSYNKLFKSQYKAAIGQILSELSSLTMRFKSIQEILYQSNPHSLLPIVSYQSQQTYLVADNINNGFVSKATAKAKDYCGFVSFEHGCCPDIDDDDNDNEGTWVISTDYNEYDLQGMDVEII